MRPKKISMIEAEREPIIENLKIEICAVLKRHALSRGWTQRSMAANLATSESTVSRICRLRTKSLTLNQLFNYLALACPHFKFLISV